MRPSTTGRHGAALFALVMAGLFCAGAWAAGLPDFTELVVKQGPAVVNISVTQRAQAQSGLPGMSEDDPFYEFFKRFGMPGGPHGNERAHETQSVGSGFIWTSDGYVLTNAHVIADADEVTVALTDKREFKAKVVGTDKRTDVALVKINATGLPQVTIGDSSKLRVGEWVVAIGEPFGLSNSVTAGIVSALGRDLHADASSLVGFIQTDAAINPGNSGGPLYNLRGEVVGMNSLIFSRTGGYMGLSFAVPINDAIAVAEQLRSSGKVRYGRIGVVVQEVTKELADAFGLDKPEGALVGDVIKGGPASKAGIESGDIILEFDGKPVASSVDLPRIVAGVTPGTKAISRIWRNGAVKEVSITVEQWQDEEQKPAVHAKENTAPNRLGLVVRALTPEEQQSIKVKGGLVIEEIRSGASNLQEGDVILGLITKGKTIDVTGAHQLDELLGKMGSGASVTLLLRRGDQQLFATVELNG